MTPKLSDSKERISLEDIAHAQRCIDLIKHWSGGCRTYDFHITSDVRNRGEI